MQDQTLAPKDPFNLTAMGIADGIALQWQQTADQPAGVDYQVQRANSAAGPWAQLTRVRSLTYTDPVVDGVIRWYRVRAVSFGAVFSNYSEVVSSTGVSVAAISANAAAALTAANNAAADAGAANAAIANISSDNVLSKGEKSATLLNWNELANGRTDARAKADLFGVSRVAYDAAQTALDNYLSALSPDWSDTATDTAIVGTTYRQKWQDAYQERQLLLNAIAAKAKLLADNAQGTADTALNNAAAAQTAATNAANEAAAASAKLADIASDSVLTPGEKPVVIGNRDTIVAEQAGIEAQATAFWITTEKTNYSAAITALTAYLATLITPVSWNVLTGNTDIVGATFRVKFGDVYSTRQLLLNKIASEAGKPPMGWVARGACEVNGTSIRRNAAGTAWDSDAYTTASYVGGAYASAQAGQTNGSAMFSLNTDPVTNSSYETLDYAWFFASDATLQIYENGGLIGSYGTYTTADFCSVQYDGSNVRYYKNGVVQRAVAVAADIRFHFDSSFATQNAVITNVAFGAMTSVRGALDAAADAAANAGAANAAIANISSDNVLSKGEKSLAVLQWNELVNGRADTRVKADKFGVPRANYDSAQTTLDNYLGSLSPGWSDFTADTPIDGGVYRSHWQNAYQERQLLLNAIAANLVAAQLAVNVINPSFEMPLYPDWQEAFGAGAETFYIEAGGFTGSKRLVKGAYAGYQAGLYNTTAKMPAKAGGSYRVRCAIYNLTGNGEFYWGIAWYDATGAYLGGDWNNHPNPVTTTGGNWKEVSRVVIAPANTAFGRVAFAFRNHNTGFWLLDSFGAVEEISNIDDLQDGNLYGRFGLDDGIIFNGIRRQGLRIPGSNLRVGDQRNLPQSNVNSYGSIRSNTALTANANGSVDVAAHTVRNGGGAQIAYSAVANAVGGLQAGVRYVIYAADPNYLGGASAWFASLSRDAVMQLGDGNYIAGEVTIPTAGTATGGTGGSTSSGGGGFDCVDWNTVLPDGRFTRGLVVGDKALCWNKDPNCPGAEWVALIGIGFGEEDCYALTTESGAVVEQSTSTPMDLRNGGIKYTPDMLGEDMLRRDKGGMLRWERVVSVAYLGLRRVVKPDFGNYMFFAGVDADNTLATHNAMFKP
ncbi:MAG: hypothetical protein WKF61_04020 [Luteimonas sp.]